MSDKNTEKRLSRERRAGRIRNKVIGTGERPRLVVYKSLKHVYAQLIDDSSRRTITGVSSMKGSLDVSGSHMVKAKAVGEAIANKAKDLGISKVVFDRSGYIYHGRVKALAESARKGGLEF